MRDGDLGGHGHPHPVAAVHRPVAAPRVVPPASVTSRSIVGGGPGVLGMADEAKPTAGSTGTRTFTYSNAEASLTMAVGLRAAAGGTSSVALSWTATPDSYATGYELVRTPGSTTAISGRTTSTTSDTAVDDATSYSYSLRAVAGSWRSTAVTTSVAAC